MASGASHCRFPVGSAMRSKSAGLVASILIVDDHAAIRRASALAFEAPARIYGGAEKPRMGLTPSAKAKKLSARSDCFGLAYASDGRSGGCAGVEETVPRVPLMMLTCYHSSAADEKRRPPACPRFSRNRRHAEPDLACSRLADGFLVDTLQTQSE